MNKGVLMAVGLSVLAGEASACSAVIVGKRASASGHVIVAHNDDGALRLKMRYAFVPAQPGKLGYFWHECKDPQGGITPGDTMLNECGVIVNSNNGGWMETWCGRKGTLPDEGVYSTLANGGVGYELRRTVAERAHTAHEGVAVATNLLATCGYTQDSRNFIIADKDEAWVLTVVRGRRYVARRCPDDAVVAYPNCMTVAKIRPDDIVSANIEPQRADFDFTAAYQGPRTWRSPYNFYRMKSLYQIVCGRAPDSSGGYPFSMRPAKLVDVEMIKAALRCHYEGTPDVLMPPHPTKADEVAEKYKAPICREGTRESYVYTFADDVKDIVLDLAVGRPCETPYETFRPHGGVLPVGALVGEAALRRMADRAVPLAPSSWASKTELAAIHSRMCAMDFNPGTPETDAARFYSNTQKTEFVAFNYDESKAGELGRDYTLEDPLTFADGRKVASVTDWTARRREILRLFEREVYGRLPPKPAEMVFEVVSEKMSEDRFATLRMYRQYFHADKTGPVIDWFVAVPRHAKGKVPVFLHLNYAGLESIAAKKTNHYDLPWDMLIASGYAFMSAKYTQITGDGEKHGGFFNGVCELWGPRDPKATDNPGSLMIWAWGLMRGLDLAEKLGEIDATRNVVIGSSRLGKAALLAAAYDERFKVCIPNQTGAVGVQLMKRNYGESLKGQHLAVPHWYCSAVWKYEDDPKSQPFDQHLLLACVAPRALLLECYHKKWFDPKGEWLAAKAASSVWEFLTGKGLGTGAWPDPYSDVLVKPPFGYVRRTECHGLSPYDWKWAIDFANEALR